MKKSWTLIKCYLFIFLALIACIIMFGCKSTEYIPVETIRTEYKTKTDTFIQKDSVLIKDSVFIHSKGNTLLYEKWHTKYVDRWRDRIITDTLIKTDSIRAPYPVERKLSKWEQFKMDCGGFLLGVIIVFFIILCIKVYLARRETSR